MVFQQDIYFMRHALTLARRGLGRVWPNPAVGCVIVHDGVVISRGWTQQGGRPHAEAMALVQAGKEARGATAYVTLEPCSHFGQTPPCARSLVNAGVARVVVACGDPDLRVAGRGLEMLRDAGVEVVTGICEAEALALNAGFLSKVEKHRPFVTMKVASTLDGKIALGNKKSQWITSAVARRHAHLVRSQHDAILVGVGTVLDDDPSLTARLGGFEHSIVRVVLDSKGRFPDGAKLTQFMDHDPLWIISEKHSDVKNLKDFGAVNIPLGDMSVERILQALAGRGITRLLVEGGARVYRSFLKAGAVDQVYWYRAPSVIGADGYDALPELGVEAMDALYRFKRKEKRVLGEDLLEIFAQAD